MSGGLMLDDTIMNLFLDTTKQKMMSVKMIFSKIKDYEIYLYQRSIDDHQLKKTVDDTKKDYVLMI